MPDQAVIDGLIDGYRNLNMRIRSAYRSVSSDLEASGTEQVMAILRAMRDRELRASQAIRSMLLGNDAQSDDELVDSTIGYRNLEETSPIVVTSQFGTAREATLAMVRELPDETWQRRFTTPRGEMTLREYLQTLVDRDRQRTDEIVALLGATRV